MSNEVDYESDDDYSYNKDNPIVQSQDKNRQEILIMMDMYLITLQVFYKENHFNMFILVATTIKH